LVDLQAITENAIILDNEGIVTNVEAHASSGGCVVCILDELMREGAVTLQVT
jgi:hypothetical protein